MRWTYESADRGQQTEVFTVWPAEATAGARISSCCRVGQSGTKINPRDQGRRDETENNGEKKG